jgi:hypothetical protein
MRSSFICLFVLTMLGAAHAADNETATAPETLKPGQVLRGTFTEQRTLQGFAKPITSSGTFVLVPGRGLIWNTQMPFATTTVINADGIVEYVKGQEAVRLSSTRLPGLARLYDVLGGAVTGDTASLASVFALKRDASAGHWRLDLTPKATSTIDATQLKSMTITGSRFVDAVDIARADNDADHIAFADQKVGLSALKPAEETLISNQRK